MEIQCATNIKSLKSTYSIQVLESTCTLLHKTIQLILIEDNFTKKRAIFTEVMA